MAEDESKVIARVLSILAEILYETEEAGEYGWNGHDEVWVPNLEATLWLIAHRLKEKAEGLVRR